MVWNKPKVGDVFTNKAGTKYEVLEYVDCFKVKVRFKDLHSYEAWFQADAVRKGKVRNPFDKSVHGIGYLGVGDAVATVNSVHTFEKGVWHGMMSRGYCRISKKRMPAYEDCTVCEEWHNFQNFAKWYKNQKFSDYKYQIDKDLLVGGNKHYSPETCCLVPQQINTVIQRSIFKKGSLPLGVEKVSGKKFRACLKTKDRYVRVGGFKTPEAAYEKYKGLKEAYVKEVADLWFGSIDNRVYEKLRDWRVEI